MCILHGLMHCIILIEYSSIVNIHSYKADYVFTIGNYLLISMVLIPMISLLTSYTNSEGFAVFYPEYHSLFITFKIVILTHLSTYKKHVFIKSFTDIANFSTD